MLSPFAPWKGALQHPSGSEVYPASTQPDTETRGACEVRPSGSGSHHTCGRRAAGAKEVALVSACLSWASSRLSFVSSELSV